MYEIFWAPLAPLTSAYRRCGSNVQDNVYSMCNKGISFLEWCALNILSLSHNDATPDDI